MPEHETLPPVPGSAVPHVGTYRRVLPVSLERMYENTLDWEHLPFVHSSSFAAIECIEAGSWGWRAEVTSAKGEASIIDPHGRVSRCQERRLAPHAARIMRRLGALRSGI